MIRYYKSKEALEIHRQLQELTKHKMLIGKDVLIEKLDKLGYDYMEYNNISSIRRKRK